MSFLSNFFCLSHTLVPLKGFLGEGFLKISPTFLLFQNLLLFFTSSQDKYQAKTKFRWGLARKKPGKNIPGFYNVQKLCENHFVQTILFVGKGYNCQDVTRRGLLEIWETKSFLECA